MVLVENYTKNSKENSDLAETLVTSLIEEWLLLRDLSMATFMVLVSLQHPLFSPDNERENRKERRDTSE